MENIVINPVGYKEEFLENLNKCFNGWGGEKKYDWVFNRKVGNYAPEMLVIENEEDGAIAGTGITYRKMNWNGKGLEFGIVTGSWTLPAARRKGCLTKMVETGRLLSRKKNMPFVSAFMVETNPSSRRLRTLGANMVSAYHLFSPEVPFEEINGGNVQVVEQNSEIIQEVYERMKRTQEDFIHFDYTVEEFEKQYIDRLDDTIVLKIDEDFAVLEKGNNEVKVLLLTHPDEGTFVNYVKLITNWCLENKSLKAFYFTVRKNLSAACVSLGFENIPGYFTILTTEKDSIYDEEKDNLHINMADKM